MDPSSRAPVPGSARLPGLEVLRWVAAFCVLLLHTEVIFGLPAVFGKGYLGVDLFFMLSGFVLTRSFGSHPPRARPVGRFIAGRYLRMWPIMALGGLIGLPLLHAREPAMISFLGMATANLALVPVAFQRDTYPLNVPAWTILFILLGNLLHRLALYRLGPVQRALGIAASAVLMGLAAVSSGSFDVGARPENAGLAVPRLLLSYLIGIALSNRRAGKPGAVLPVLALLAMPVLVAAAWWCGVSSWLFDMGFVIFACPLMIAGAVRLETVAAWPGFSGAWSFPLYAIHFPLLIRLRNHGFAAAPAVVIALTFSALVTWTEIQLRAKFKRGATRHLR